ncbi:hypothetical protein, partial [Streptomyces sp. CoT10]|uniref:hypothetical protein n=1 Tax=Streptomyces sp. CoT10 TaxID=2875762 RepID=UPI001CD1A2CA
MTRTAAAQRRTRAARSDRGGVRRLTAAEHVRTGAQAAEQQRGPRPEAQGVGGLSQTATAGAHATLRPALTALTTAFAATLATALAAVVTALATLVTVAALVLVTTTAVALGLQHGKGSATGLHATLRPALTALTALATAFAATLPTALVALLTALATLVTVAALVLVTTTAVALGLQHGKGSATG